MDNRIEKYGKLIYHYTSFETFYKIIESGNFWLGNLSNMNDTSEMFHFISLLQDSTLRRLSYDKTATATCKNFFDKVFEKMNRGSFFAASFSTALDDAAMWERYGDRGRGVCLAVDTSKIFELIHGFSMILNEEFYTSNADNHKFVSLIAEYCLTGNLETFSSEAGLVDNIIATSILHKSPSFKSEQEIRLAIIIENGKLTPGSICFCPTGHRIRKVLVFNVADNLKSDNLINKVIIGPCSKQNPTDLCEYLNFRGYSELANHVCSSKCPLREYL